MKIIADSDTEQSFPDVSEQLSLAHVVLFCRRNWALVLGPALAVGLAAALLLYWITPCVYEASSILVVVPPKFSSDLKPNVLTVHGYQKLLESDAVVAEAKRELVRQDVLEEGVSLRMDDNIRSEVFVSRRAEETSLAPMVEVFAQGQTPDQAAEIANAWVNVFLKRVLEVMEGTTSSTVKFIEQQYPDARKKLKELEERKKTQNNEFQRRHDDALTEWDERIGAFQNETTDRVAASGAETLALLAAFSKQSDQAAGIALEPTASDTTARLREELAKANEELQRRQVELNAAWQQLARTPQFLTLRKTITDDALSLGLILADKRPLDWSALRDYGLLSQQVNPVHAELRAKAVEVEMDVHTLIHRAARLSRQLAAARGGHPRGATTRDSGTAGAASAPGEPPAAPPGSHGEQQGDPPAIRALMARNEELARLLETRSRQLDALVRQKRQQVNAIIRDAAFELGQLEREITGQRLLHDQVQAKFNQATLAKAQENMADIRLGAMAVPPDRPKPRGLAFKSMLGVVAGGLVGLLVALVRDANGRVRASPLAAGPADSPPRPGGPDRRE